MTSITHAPRIVFLQDDCLSRDVNPQNTKVHCCLETPFTGDGHDSSHYLYTRLLPSELDALQLTFSGGSDSGLTDNQCFISLLVIT